MKKLFALLICLSVLLGITTFPVNSLSVEMPVILGDANYDGVVNGMDLLALKKHILGMEMLNGYCVLAGDTTRQGKINGLSLLALKKHILGIDTLVTPLPLIPLDNGLKTQIIDDFKSKNASSSPSISRFYGTYSGSTAVKINDGRGFTTMGWTETVSGYTFKHKHGDSDITIHNNGDFYSLTEAYDSGLLSKEAIRDMYWYYYAPQFYIPGLDFNPDDLQYMEYIPINKDFSLLDIVYDRVDFGGFNTVRSEFYDPENNLNDAAIIRSADAAYMYSMYTPLWAEYPNIWQKSLMEYTSSDYFEENVLIILKMPAGSGSKTFTINQMLRFPSSDNELYINMQTNIPMPSTDDFLTQSVVIEVKKADIEGIDTINVYNQTFTIDYNNLKQDWNFYRNAEELLNESNMVFVGTVKGFSFEIVDTLTFDKPNESTEKHHKTLYTLYDIDVKATYMGDASDSVQMRSMGGIKGIRVKEQYDLIKEYDAYGNTDEGVFIPISPDFLKIGLEVGETYLFVLRQYEDYPLILLSNIQSIYPLDKPAENNPITIQDIISYFGEDKWDDFVNIYMF